MSEQPTEPYPGWYPTISQQRPALLALTYLASTFPTLPSAYIVVHAHGGDTINLQMRTGTEVEAWRTALQVPADTVRLHRYSDYTTVDFTAVVTGVLVKMYGTTPLLPDRAVLSPAEDAEQRAQAAQQPTAIERGRAGAEAWNAVHPVGTPVNAYPQTRQDEPLLTRTRSEAWALGHGEPVVMVEGYAGGIALTHVDARVEDIAVVTAPRPDPLDSALMSAWAQSEPEGPECQRCGNRVGPWAPVASGDRWPSGAQVLVCKDGCAGGAA